MPRRNTSQKLIILNLLKQGIPVTPMMALNRCGCFRLAAVINMLRKEGNEIETKRVRSHTGNKYAEYTLA
jgi:phage terminase Nu1 subunit (DNA packaging protein)